MKNSRFLVSISIFTTILFSNCKKRPIADIELFGQVVDTTSFGSTPLQAQIKLWTGGPPGESGSTFFGETATYPDGTFNIQSKAGWNSSQYYLVILTSKGSSTRKHFVPKNGSLDVGVVAF